MGCKLETTALNYKDNYTAFRIRCIMLILEILQKLTSFLIRIILSVLVLPLKPHIVFLLPFETFLLSRDDF